LALLGGGIFGAMLGGRFAFQAVGTIQVVRSLIGGSIMGFAATLVPGGNDVLLLNALPSLALHGAFAYLAMLGVQITAALWVKRWKDRQVQRGKVARGCDARAHGKRITGRGLYHATLPRFCQHTVVQNSALYRGLWETSGCDPK
jgi:sulfur transporter